MYRHRPASLIPPQQLEIMLAMGMNTGAWGNPNCNPVPYQLYLQQQQLNTLADELDQLRHNY